MIKIRQSWDDLHRIQTRWDDQRYTDKNGDLIDGNVTRYFYDDLDRKVESIYQDMTSESWTYNADSELLTHTNQNGSIESWIHERALPLDLAQRLLDQFVPAQERQHPTQAYGLTSGPCSGIGSESYPLAVVSRANRCDDAGQAGLQELLIQYKTQPCKVFLQVDKEAASTAVQSVGSGRAGWGWRFGLRGFTQRRKGAKSERRLRIRPPAERLGRTPLFGFAPTKLRTKPAPLCANQLQGDHSGPDRCAAIRANNIGTILLDQGDPAGALRFMDRSLRIFEVYPSPLS